MKKLFLILLTLGSFAEADPANLMKSPRFQHSLGGDFTIWYELLQLSQSTNYESKAENYGMGINYELTQYKPSWGYGVLFGFAQGFGITGSTSSAYFEKRVPWTASKIGTRIFTRANENIDLGLQLLVSFRQMTWPSVGAFQPSAVTNPLLGTFIDIRYKLNSNYDFSQSLGVHTKEPSMVWKIGFNYFF